jgi:hypothetical protein
MTDQYLVVFYDTTLYKTDDELQRLLEKLTPISIPRSKPIGAIAISCSELEELTIKQKRKLINEAFKWKAILDREAVVI